MNDPGYYWKFFDRCVKYVFLFLRLAAWSAIYTFWSWTSLNSSHFVPPAKVNFLFLLTELSAMRSVVTPGSEHRGSSGSGGTQLVSRFMIGSREGIVDELILLFNLRLHLDWDGIWKRKLRYNTRPNQSSCISTCFCLSSSSKSAPIHKKKQL